MESRIRLEGRLETVERATWALERGLRAADRADWEPLRRAIELQESAEVRQALEQVQKMTAQDPALSRTLDRFWAAVHTAEHRVVARALTLRMSPAPLLPAVRGLCEDPVVFTGRKSKRWMVQAVTVAAVLAVSAAAIASKGHFPFYLIALLVIALRSSKLSPMNVIVTRHRVLLKDEVLDLHDVVSAKFEKRDREERELPFTLVLRLKNGQQRVEHVPEVDRRLVDALRGGGVLVDV